MQLVASLFGADLRDLGKSLYLPLLLVATLVPVASAVLSRAAGRLDAARAAAAVERLVPRAAHRPLRPCRFDIG